MNKNYRIKSCLGDNDAYAISGSEDGHIYAWDIVTGEMVKRVLNQSEAEMSRMRSSKKVVNTVACKRKNNEWASADGDGMCCFCH